LFLAGCATHEEPAVKPVVEVKVARAEIADVRIAVHAPATVFAREQANISARVTAPIRKLLVRKGDNVSAGQVLAQLDNRDIIAQRDEAQAAVADAQANLQRVTSGTVPTDLEKARGQVATAEAALNQAKKFQERRQQLFQQGAIPQRELMISDTELAQAKTTYEVAKKSMDLLKNQSSDRDILSARSKLEQAQAHVASLKAQVDFTEIHSPFAGVVTEQFQYPGDMAKPDVPMFTVMDLSIAIARGQVPDAEAGAVRIGQACTFTPTDNSAAYEGHVSVVSQAIDPARRTVETWCEIANPKRTLRGGTFGELSITTGTAAKSVLVPQPAVQFIEGTHKGIVMVATEKGVAAKKEVETGEVFDGKVQIRSGLNGGELVIVQGGYGLPDGTQIRVQEEKKP
jgi:multidrug efflux pump subunit AcrA (membrane-fusion protein)